MVGSDGSLDEAGLLARVPEGHKAFATELMARHGLDVDYNDPRFRPQRMTLLPEVSARLMDVAFAHPIRLIANALGLPPPSMIARGKARGVAVAALVGAREHAVRQVEAGVDIIVAQGSEAGGHCGEVSTLVLVPEVLKAVKAVRDVPVLAAGGIVTGAQMAAMMALGADGAWTGSVWLMTTESEVSPYLQQKFAAARSRDAIRSRSRTGKPARQLRSSWTDAWELDPASPGPLPMPLQLYLSDPSLRRADAEANKGQPGAQQLATYFIGQGVGLLDDVKSARTVVREFMEDYAEASLRLANLASD
jgi:NAD(P)H-dependent flavin oxidoreductase YrpB (nitropropane dioxygenase family)